MVYVSTETPPAAHEWYYVPMKMAGCLQHGGTPYSVWRILVIKQTAIVIRTSLMRKST